MRCGRLELAGIGLATAQGSARELLEGGPLREPVPLPFELPPRSISTLCRPAQGVDPALRGHERWNALARVALAECAPQGGFAPGTALVLASCNGGANALDEQSWLGSFDSRVLLAGTPFAASGQPILSASCASGLHGLFTAGMQLAAGADEVVLLAVDILSFASQVNFESLRVLSASVENPWQPSSSGFVVGEAAVALRLRREDTGKSRGTGRVVLGMPALFTDLTAFDGLSAALSAVRGRHPPRHALGQATGPTLVNQRELEALRLVAPHAWLSTPSYAFGHTLACSALLSVALCALAEECQEVLPALSLPVLDGLSGPKTGAPSSADALVACRALNGSCAAVRVGADSEAKHAPPRFAYRESEPSAALHLPLLRRVHDAALSHRPAEPPDALIVVMDCPLLPPERSRVAGRLLPSAVVEITPSHLGQTVARRWGYCGPVLTLVGASPDASALAALRGQLSASVLYAYQDGVHADIEWRC